MKIKCYLLTIKDWRIFVMALFNWGALYINHDYREQKSYIKGNKIYDPIKCRRCGDVSVAWRQF